MAPESWFRLAFGLVLAVNLGVSGYFRRRARVEAGRIRRTDEPTRLILLRLLLVLPTLYLFVAYLVAPSWMAWSRIPLPETLRWIGAAIGFALVPANVWLLSSLGSNISETVLVKKNHQLVERGPYRWVRHPLYACGIALVAALGLIASSWAILALAVLFALLSRTVVIPREEEELLTRFGSRYEAYRRRTGALLPRLR